MMMTREEALRDYIPTRHCHECLGLGYTPKTATEMRNNKTVAQGSGCPECGGTGDYEAKP